MGDTLFLPVDAAYDRWSRFYDSYDNPMVYLAGAALHAGLAASIAGGSVFEFGCGTGRNLAQLADAGAVSLTGCDLSEGMLNVARERRLPAHLFRHDMTQPLPGGIAPVDAVLFCLTLEHIADLRVPLAEAKRILRPAGEVRVLEIHPFFSLSGVAAHFHEDGQEVRMPAYPHQFAAYLNAFASAGLGVHECREWRPRDLGVPDALKSTKLGPDFPMLVEFKLLG